MADLLSKDCFRAQPFHRHLLSVYDTDITLQNYVDYFELKKIAKEIEKIVVKLAGHPTIQSFRQQQLLNFTGNMNESIEFDSELASSLSNVYAPKNAPITIPRETLTSPAASIRLPHPIFRPPSTDVFVGEGDSAFDEQSHWTREMLLERRTELQKEFFHKLHSSLEKVCAYVERLDQEATETMHAMKQLSEKQILSHENPHYLEDLYIRLQAIEQYRTLNLQAIQRLCTKFLTRCAHDSLILQGDVSEMMQRVSKSALVHSTIDLRGHILEVITVFGIVQRLSYEESIALLRQYEARRGKHRERILSAQDTFFFNSLLPRQKLTGPFAIKVLAGSTSQQMEKTLNAVLRCPRFSETSSCEVKANDEVCVRLTESVRGSDVFVVQSTVHTPQKKLTLNGTFMELALVLQAASIAGAKRITAVVPYLGYTRDTVSISAVAEIIETMGCDHLITVDTGSEQVEGCFTIPLEIVSAKLEFVKFVGQQLKDEGSAMDDITIVAPRDLYLRRAKDFADALMRHMKLDSTQQFVSVCTAVRRQVPLCEEDGDEESHTAEGEGPLTGGSPSSTHGPLSSVSQPVETPLKEAEKSNTSSNRGTFPSTKMTESEETGADAYPPDVISSPLLQGNPGIAAGIQCALEQQLQGRRSIICSQKERNKVRRRMEEDTLWRESSRSPSNSSPGSKAPQKTVPATSHSLLATRTQGLLNRRLGIEDDPEYEEKMLQDLMEDICFVGNVKDRVCIIVDTMIDEGIELVSISRCLLMHGAKRVISVATHAIFSGKAVERMRKAPVDLIFVSDSINQDAVMRDPEVAKKLRIVPISPLLALAIEKIHTENKLTTLL